jgi:glycosyltransferase involved in cell wall biosynthesis
MKSESKKNQPKISVIIPTYNRVHLIGRAIESVLNQTYQDFEIIVVDDGSTDNTEKLIKNFQKKDKRIKYIQHKENKGEGAARNTGIKISKSPFIAFQDSDDESFPQRLEKQIKVFENESQKVGLVYSDMLLISNKGQKKYFMSPRFTPENGFIYEKALNYEILGIGIGTSLMPKRCFKVVGFFDDKIPYFVDVEFFIRLSKYFYFYHISEPLINFYRLDYNGVENFNSSPKNLVISRKLILKKYFFDIKKDRETLAKHYLSICISLYKNNEFEEAREYSQFLTEIYSCISKDKKILSSHLYSIYNYLYLNGNFLEGRKYLIKAAKKHPTNIRVLLKAFISLFGKDIYIIIVRIYKNIGINRKNN